MWFNVRVCVLAACEIWNCSKLLVLKNTNMWIVKHLNVVMGFPRTRVPPGRKEKASSVWTASAFVVVWDWLWKQTRTFMLLGGLFTTSSYRLCGHRHHHTDCGHRHHHTDCVDTVIIIQTVWTPSSSYRLCGHRHHHTDCADPPASPLVCSNGLVPVVPYWRQTASTARGQRGQLHVDTTGAHEVQAEHEQVGIFRLLVLSVFLICCFTFNSVSV